MKHVIYRTEHYSRGGAFLGEEEYDAYFQTLDNDIMMDIAVQPPVGCRLLLPKLVPSRISEKQWEKLCSKKPGYQLRYASLYDEDQLRYAIYAIYERMVEDDDYLEPYMAHVSIGETGDVTLDMCVVPTDYDLHDIHITKWDAVDSFGETGGSASRGISISAAKDPAGDKGVTVFYDDLHISGRWISMEQVSPRLFVYHCRNSLFRFDVSFNIERYPWDGDYESLLHH